VKAEIIELVGDAYHRGFIHGKTLKKEIRECIDYYGKILHMDKSQLATNGMLFKKQILKKNNDYSAEIKGIAKGANVPEGHIYAINARSELLSFAQECTTLSFPNIPLSAQTWDWGEKLESLFRIVRIKYDDGHEILQMIEPGMLGKIGMNNKGIAVCLNALNPYKKMNGLPIHIVLRLVLDARTHEEARKVLMTAHGCSGNILATFSDKTFLNVEQYGDEIFIQQGREIFFHTNHYLTKDITKKTFENNSSYERYRTLKQLKQVKQTRESAKAILSNTTNVKYPISRPFAPHVKLGEHGTVCNIILDLSKGCMHITPGRPSDNEYQTFFLQEQSN